MSAFRCFNCGAHYDQHTAFCGLCWNRGTVVVMGRRASAMIDTVPEILAAPDLLRAQYQAVEIRAYPEITLMTKAFVTLVGPPSQGKSTMAVRMVDSVRGPGVIASFEEQLGASVASRFARVGAKRADLYVCGPLSVDQLAKLAVERKATALAVDSVQESSFTASELRHLLIVVPTLRVLVCTSQVNKKGAVSGTMRLEHESDVVIDVADMRWSVRKSRYDGERASGAVLATEQPMEVSNG